MKRAFTLAALGFLLGAASAIAEDRRAPLVVELFTSQGCSSCPTADRIFRELVDRGDVLALAFHVDYWDHLGWKDTLATRKGTARQYAYRESLQERMVFTPQIVVDGRVSVSGTDRAAVLAVLEKERQRLPAGSGIVPLLIESLPRPDGGMELRLPASPDPGVRLPVWLVEYDDRQTVTIAKGENAGATYVYRHPVRAVRRIGEWTGEATEISLPPGGVTAGRGAVVLAQEERAGPIRAAGRLSQAR